MHPVQPDERPISGLISPDWRRDDAYLPLVGADVSAFAWEWLRRSPEYRRAWSRDDQWRGSGRRLAGQFGLEDLEDPSIGTPWARPVWSRTVLPDLLTASVADIHAPRSERVDLRLLSSLVTIVIGQDEMEHLLFSDGRRFLRIDLLDGTLIGCPSALNYLLRGLSRLQGPIASLNRLTRLVREGSFEGETPAVPSRHRRWIMELRVADAIVSGADQQTIARTLFGSRIADRRWRVESSSYRRQVQRLVSEARSKLRAPPERWFRS